MKTIIREEQCLVCKGTGQRSWLYRHWEDAAGMIFCLIVYIWFWDMNSLGWKIIFVAIAALSAINIAIEKNKNKRGKCKNCGGTGRIVLEEIIEGK